MGCLPTTHLWGGDSLGTTGQGGKARIAPAVLPLHQQYSQGTVPRFHVPGDDSAAVLEDLAEGS